MARITMFRPFSVQFHVAPIDGDAELPFPALLKLALEAPTTEGLFANLTAMHWEIRAYRLEMAVPQTVTAEQLVERTDELLAKHGWKVVFT